MHTPIRVLVGSADVLHSWALNGAGIKVDAVPGRIIQLLYILHVQGIFMVSVVSYVELSWFHAY